MAVDYPSVEFIAKRKEPDGKGGFSLSESPFFMDLRGSNATRDHVMTYINKGFQVVGLHNVSTADLKDNENWQGVVSLVNSFTTQTAAAVKRAKPLAEVVKSVGAKING